MEQAVCGIDRDLDCCRRTLLTLDNGERDVVGFSCLSWTGSPNEDAGTPPAPLVDSNTAPAGHLAHDNVRVSGGVSDRRR